MRQHTLKRAFSPRSLQDIPALPAPDPAAALHDIALAIGGLEGDDPDVPPLALEDVPALGAHAASAPPAEVVAVDLPEDAALFSDETGCESEDLVAGGLSGGEASEGGLSAGESVASSGFAEYYKPDAIQGCVVTRERHKNKGYVGLRVQCPLHEGCSKYRSCRLWQAQIGHTAAADFLNAWLNAGIGIENTVEHMRYMPTLAETRANPCALD